MELDTTKLVQAGQRKLTPHDNCVVLDVGTGTFPRLVELRLPGIDGARQSALWDGSIDLAVNDIVIADEYSGQTVWRISSMGGGDSGAGKTRVNKVWASDFTSESLVTDATDNVTINTGTLTLPSDIIHLGDVDNKISFTDDVQTYTVGGVELLKLTEAAQNLINLGPGSGDLDIDFNGDMFIQGSDGYIGIGPAFQSPTAIFHIKRTTSGAGLSLFKVESSNEGGGFSVEDQAGTGFLPGFVFTSAGVSGFGGLLIGKIPVALDAIGTARAAIAIDGRRDTGAALAAANLFVVRNFGTTHLTINFAGDVGLNGVTSPSTELDIGAGAIEFDEMTAPGAGAANTARLYAVDNGAGKTQLIVIFSSGAAQVLATQP